MARIKKVYRDFADVCRLWANQSQDSAECSNWSRPGGRFAYWRKDDPNKPPCEKITPVYFSGRDLYSYGSHYLLGRILEINGHRVAVVNFSRYSVSTGSHSWAAMRACESAGIECIRVNENVGNIRDGASNGGLRYDTTNQDIIDTVRETFEERANGHYSHLATLTYAAESEKSARLSLESVAEFSALVTRFGFPELVISVPEDFREFVLNVGYFLGRARACHNRRHQSTLGLDKGKPVAQFPVSYYGRDGAAARRLVP